MVKKWAGLLLAVALLFLLKKSVLADEHNGVPGVPSNYIQPVNTSPVPFKVVSGTVTVRFNGVLVDAQQVSYLFSPAFKDGTDDLARMDLGLYFMKADRVPSDQNYTLTISATYNSSIAGGDGVTQQTGQIYRGSVQIDVPYGEDAYDFGVRFIDVQ